MQALILAGGRGTRFWPLSRKSRPKQLLPMAGHRSLLLITVERLDPLIRPEQIWVCTTDDLAAGVESQLPTVPRAQILADPQGRNTAPAISWAVSEMPDELQKGVVVVLPADHFMADSEGFRETLRQAAEVAASDRRIMTLGVRPTRAETGYGYLEMGSELPGPTGLRQVRRFTEKPDPETAQQFFESDHYLWNAGIFVFPGDLLLQRLAELHSWQGRRPDRLSSIYEELPSISIDHAVMEKLEDLGTLPLDCGWSDLGSWEALWELLQHDEDGNAIQGSAIVIDSEDSLVYSDSGTIAMIGVSGLVVVKTKEAVLVIPKERSQEVRRIIAMLQEGGQSELL